MMSKFSRYIIYPLKTNKPLSSYMVTVLCVFILDFFFFFGQQATIYSGEVLSLKLQKPAGFQYCSGMYIFVQCPQISIFEW